MHASWTPDAKNSLTKKLSESLTYKHKSEYWANENYRYQSIASSFAKTRFATKASILKEASRHFKSGCEGKNVRQQWPKSQLDCGQRETPPWTLELLISF